MAVDKCEYVCMIDIAHMSVEVLCTYNGVSLKIVDRSLSCGSICECVRMSLRVCVCMCACDVSASVSRVHYRFSYSG